MARAVRFVGDFPAADSGDAMRTALRLAGKHVHAIAEGELFGGRVGVATIIDDLRWDFDLQQLQSGRWTSYEDVPRYRVRRGHRFIGDHLDLPYVANFDNTYPIFRRLRAESIRHDLTFQVGLPGDLDLAWFAFGPRRAQLYRRPFADALGRQMVRIHARAGEDVVFQLELLAETALVANARTFARRRVADQVARDVADLVRRAPHGSRFGLHLCLGDINHQAMVHPRRASPMVLLANAIVSRWPDKRTLEWVHIPFAAAADPPSLKPRFYAPLRRLELPPETRLVAGIVHERRGLADLLVIRDIIESRTGRQVDVATSCGLGRLGQATATRMIELACDLVA